MKKLLNIFFVVFHIVLSYWGCNQLTGQWIAPHARNTTIMVIALLILLVVSNLYMLLAHKRIIGYLAAVICVISNLVLCVTRGRFYCHTTVPLFILLLVVDGEMDICINLLF